MVLAARAADTASGTNALQGTWALVGIVDDGNAAPPDALEGARAVFSGNRLTLVSPGGDEKTEYTIRVDPTRRPAVIDLIRLEGTFAGQNVNGIYELDGATLRICAPLRPGAARPKQFSAPPESGLFLLVMRKVNQ
jgi:uncharacterized protein (TIGR03067 family)